MQKRIAYFIGTVLLLIALQYILLASHYSFDFASTKHTFKFYLGTMIWNIIILYLFYKIISILTNKIYFSWLILSSITIIFSVANYFMILYRDEPILPNDLTMISNMGDILSYINKSDLIVIIVTFVLLIAALVGTYFIKKQVIFDNKKERLIQGGIVFIVTIILFWGSNLDNIFYKLGTKFGYSNQFWDMEHHYKQNGPLVGFLSISDVIAMDSLDYKEEDVNFLDKYDVTAEDKEDKEDNQIVVYILSESFVDPMRIEGANLSADPIPFIRSIMNDYTSGLLYQSTIGGGTSKAEYEALTSFSNSYFHKSVSTPYQFPLPDLPSHPMIGDLFDTSIAIHSSHAKLYRRVEVFETMGFDRFKYQGNTDDDLIYIENVDNHRYISDLSAKKEVLHTINEIDPNENAFIYLATIQNHSPYTKSSFDSIDFSVDNPIYDPTVKESFEAYLQGLHETDKAVEFFIKELEKIDRPVTVVFFGDHYPPFAKTIVAPTENFKTDYFIYQNYQQKKLEYPIISPNFLSAVTMQLIDLQPSPFYQFLGDMLNEYTVLHAQSIVRDGKTFESISSEPISSDTTIIDFYEKYKLLQYDIVAGKQYSIDNGNYSNK